jgi:hypothetical protein|tara:strand:- start:503 stop:1333 length:831 start_codon:yes stop_codon:yes gene_type:complete
MKIAVCISGELRDFDIFSKLFAYWNNLYDEVEFDFFLATWKDENANKLNFDFVTKYNFFTFDDIPNYIRILHQKNSFLFYSYLMYKVHELRRSISESCTKVKTCPPWLNNFSYIETIPSYDCVIQTRPDIFISKILLDSIVETPIEYFTPNLIFTSQGTSSNKSGGVTVKDDNFSYGHTASMDKLSYMYHDCYILGNNYGTVHDGNANQMVNHNIVNSKYDFALKPMILRNQPTKKGHPTSEWLRNKIDTNGVEFLFDKTNSFAKWQNIKEEWIWK